MKNSNSAVMAGYEATSKEQLDAEVNFTPMFSAAKYSVIPSSPLTAILAMSFLQGRTVSFVMIRTANSRTVAKKNRTSPAINGENQE